MTFAMKLVAAGAILVCAGAAVAQKGETVKMVRIDAQSGGEPDGEGEHQE